MRKFLVMLALITSFASFAQAQDTDSRGEFFAGYSLLRTDIDSEDFSDFSDSNDEPFKNLNGFNLAATGYLTERFGITGDFSAHFKNEGLAFPAVVGAPTSGEAKARTLNFLGGPQVRFSNSTRVTPFVRALAGVQNNRIEFDVAGGTGGATGDDFESSQTDFALALGGGLDVRVNDRFAIRAFQIDYNPVFARDREDFFGPGDDLVGERTDNVRFSIGVVFK